MLAECVRTFLDIKTGELRKEGQRFEVTAERFSDINSTRYGQLVIEVEETPAEEASEPQRARRGTRKPKKAEE